MAMGDTRRMIDSNGHVRCSKCGREHALKLDGKLEWYCPRCKCFNHDTSERLDNKQEPVVCSSHSLKT